MSYTSKKIKKQVKYCDWMMVTVFIFMLLTRILTISYFAQISEETGVSIEKIATAYEQSPVTATLINLRKTGGILLTLILPAMVMAVYIAFRKLALKGKIDIRDLMYAVNLAFFIFFINVVNDTTYYLARLLG